MTLACLTLKTSTLPLIHPLDVGASISLETAKHVVALYTTRFFLNPSRKRGRKIFTYVLGRKLCRSNLTIMRMGYLLLVAFNYLMMERHGPFKLEARLSQPLAPSDRQSFSCLGSLIYRNGHIAGLTWLFFKWC